MSKTSQAAPDSRTAPRAAPSGRLISIDVLRGLAILGAITYHLWGDFVYYVLAGSHYYGVLRDRVFDGDPAAFRALMDLVIRLFAYQVVPMFMMLSGLVLTRSALLSGGVRDPARFIYRHIRRLTLPYWFGFVYTMAVIALVALVQAQLHGGGFVYQIQHGVTFGRKIYVPMDWGYVIAGATMVPRAVREKWMYAPESVLWFVPLLLQYYILFPILYRLLLRIGPWAFVVATAVFTVAFQALAIGLWDAYSYQNLHGWILSPFRLSEFTIGMTLGYLIVERRSWLAGFASRRPDVLALVLVGFALQTTGSLIGTEHHYWFVFSSTVIIAGLSLMSLPFILAPPHRLEVNRPLRLLAWIGGASYAVLIVNEPFRYIMSLMRLELPVAVWLPVLVVFYYPLSVLLARPVAVFFGLTPKAGAAPAGAARKKRAVEPAPQPAAEPAASRTTERERWMRLIFVAAVIVHVVMFVSLFQGYLNPLFDNADQQRQAIDFFSIYQGGTRALHLQGIYSWTIPDSVPYAAPYRYLPVFAFTGGIAFNALRPWAGYWLWVDLIEIMLVANAWMTFRMTRDRSWRWVAAALWFVFTPVYLEEYMGQWSFLMATLMFWTAVTLAEGRRALSGAWWGASVLIKTNSALLGPIFLRLRQWRVLFAVGAALVVFNVPYFAFHPHDGRYFWDTNFGQFNTTAQDRLSYLNSGELGAVAFLRTVWLSFDTNASRMPVSIERAFVLAVIALSFAATFLPRRTDVIALFGVWSCSFFLVYFAWEHHYVMLLPALVLLVALRPGYRLVALAAFVILALPTPYVIFEHYYGVVPPDPPPFGYSPQWSWPAWAGIVDHAAKTLPVMMLWSALVAQLLREWWRERALAPASDVLPAGSPLAVSSPAPDAGDASG